MAFGCWLWKHLIGVEQHERVDAKTGKTARVQCAREAPTVLQQRVSSLGYSFNANLTG